MICEIPVFGRCCFCLPLRRGIILFGYINAVFSLFMVGVYSCVIHNGYSKDSTLMFRGVVSGAVAEFCVFLYCIEVVVNCLLCYGAHEKKVRYVKIFYYYSITTTFAALMLGVVEVVGLTQNIGVIEMAVLTFLGLCIQLYLIFLVRSLINKLDIGSSHSYDNQLHMVVSGETKTDNGVYNNNTVVPNV